MSTIAADCLDDIISIFIQRNVIELSGHDLYIAIREEGKSYSVEEINRVVQLRGSSLFHFDYNQDNTYLIRVEPKIGICKNFLAGKCNSKIQTCDLLHICRRFGNCNRKDCNFPHNFNRGNNRRLVVQFHCQTIDSLLLVRLIRHHEQFCQYSDQTTRAAYTASTVSDIASSSVQPKPIQSTVRRKKRIRSRRNCPRNNTEHVTADEGETNRPGSLVLLSSDSDYQVDISLPSTANSSRISIEDIIGLLRKQGHSVQKTLNLKIDRYFHRYTLQFQEQNAVDNLLEKLNLIYGNICVNFKKTKAPMDQRSFILQSRIDLKRGVIPMQTFSTYVDTLIGNYVYKITDLSTLVEQIILIECTHILDFEQLYRKQKSRRQLRGTDVLLRKIYEIEMVIIESINNSLSVDLIENMIELARPDVFTYRLLSQKTAIIEFTNCNHLKHWLSFRDKLQKCFSVKITLDVKYIDDDNDDAHEADAISCFSTDERSEKSIETKTAVQMVIYFGRGKTMIANHPKFSIEYKNFIRSELGIEIRIRGKRIEIDHSSISAARFEENIQNLLRIRTQQFMRQFAFRTVVLNQAEEQINILRENSTTVAFHNIKDNTYLVAVKQLDIENIMTKLFARTQVDSKSENPQCSAASSNPKKSKTVRRKKLSKLTIPPPLSNCSTNEDKPVVNNTMDVKKQTLTFDNRAQAALFNDQAFEYCLQSYFNTNYAIKLIIEHNKEVTNQCLIRLVGKQCKIDLAMKELLVVSSSCRTKIFNEPIDKDWIKINDAIRVIQNHLNMMNIKCVCQQQLFPISILVHYIDKEYRALGVDEQIIDTLCRKKLVLAKCTSNKFEKEWKAVRNEVLQRDHYGRDICLLDEQYSVSLYGLPDIVKQVQKLFEDKKMVAVQPTTKTNTSKSDQIFIPESNILKKDSFAKLNESSVHQQCNPIKTETIQTHSITFDIDEPGFEVLVEHNLNQLMALVDSSCRLEKQIICHKIQIEIPKPKQHHSDNSMTQTQEQINNSEPTRNPTTDSANASSSWFFKLFQTKKTNTSSSNSSQNQSSTLATSSPSTPTTSVNVAIGNSNIIVCTGDLAKQVVDIIVVCSTSRILCDAIISAAGPEIVKAYNQQSAYGSLGFETDGGNLQCKKIVFRPWMNDQNQWQDLNHSIQSFVRSVIQYALCHDFKTIAFPSIGCGRLGYDPRSIAEYMISETHRQLTVAPTTSLVVSFVLLHGQQNVYDAFADFLSKMQSIQDKPNSISFDKQIVRIKLSGSNKNQLIEYQDKIKNLAQSSSIQLHLKDENDMSDWPQDVIMQYYDYCLQRRVIPAINIENSTLDLIGSKDTVSDAEKYFFQLTAETLRNAKLKFVLRGFIWSVETSPEKWDSYPYKTNELIENAQSKKSSYVEFMNEKSEQCRLIFSSMEEHCQAQKRKRKVRRTRIDSSLPSHWDLSDSHLRRIILLDSSKEYKDILNQFNSTMKGNYARIIQIERIQNERWYKQYAAHRDEFTQRYGQPDERRLFHGCSSTSADQIVRECFNRAFAGLNGTLFGQGVYFHAHAKYSHSYTKPGISNERTMFLALVLIGKTCTGNSSMKVPPSGFDTTTDGSHIFVVYHDAGAYGEYLITYK